METNKVLQEALNKALSDAQTIVSDLKAAGATVIEIDAPSFGNHSGKVEKPTLEDVALKESLDLGASKDSGQTTELLAVTGETSTITSGPATSQEVSESNVTSEGNTHTQE